MKHDKPRSAEYLTETFSRAGRNRIISFKHAFAGIGYILRTQPNARIHAVFTIAVLFVGLWLKIENVEWAAISIVIGAVWTAEFINSAIEAVVDLASPEYHELAKAGKDTAAAAVLVTAVISVVVGLLVLGPPLLEKLSGWPG